MSQIYYFKILIHSGITFNKAIFDLTCWSSHYFTKVHRGNKETLLRQAFFPFLLYIESVFVTFLCDLFQTCETRCLLAEKIVILAKNNKIHYFFRWKRGKQQNMQRNYVEFVVCVRKISSFLLWVRKWTFWPFFLLHFEVKIWNLDPIQ